MSLRDRLLDFGISQGFQGCQKKQKVQEGLRSRDLLPLERVQKSGKLHITTSECPQVPEAVLT